jgi:hypothetical protein
LTRTNDGVRAGQVDSIGSLVEDCWGLKLQNSWSVEVLPLAFDVKDAITIFWPARIS